MYKGEAARLLFFIVVFADYFASFRLSFFHFFIPLAYERSLQALPFLIFLDF
jgi:hypothetical protein